MKRAQADMRAIARIGILVDQHGSVTSGITSRCSRRLTLSRPWLSPSPRQRQSLLSPGVRWADLRIPHGEAPGPDC